MTGIVLPLMASFFLRKHGPVDGSMHTSVVAADNTERECFLKQTSLVVMASSPDNCHSRITPVGRHGNVQDFPVSSGRIELLNGVKKSVSIIPGIIINHRYISILFEIVDY